MPATTLQVACLCGAISQQVKLKAEDGFNILPLSLCHCDTCRHTSGLLCTSYYPTTAPELSSSLKTYRPTSTSTRYFCSTCGCHLFQARQTASKGLEWGTATGAVTCLPTQSPSPGRYVSHQHVSDTGDGGLSVWMKNLAGYSEEGTAKAPASQSIESANESLEASCSCGNVRFHITRPNEDSRGPSRNFPDLMFPDKTTDEHIKQNSADEKWWIQDNGNKYLAGTCACRSCRLISGFEVQTWAFVPRANIFFHTPEVEGAKFIVPLDFATLPPGILTSYSSSPNVRREFCGTCGATIFWHEKSPDDVIDISVGLLRAPDGARAENWLEWWQERVSFAEEADTERTGSEAKVASELISSLESGMKARNKSGSMNPKFAAF
ncbi:Mss4-like protein [Dactylonectria macrodidyma]|uniref:Mss4-like protein n=1 Tax=Dactylonectria macrodidyma TaxID=307937 RepID=A0A9P9DYQ1_9HYPO|nr:Mss4-like protein [Dactylonectria macrodidyma]